ncbi:hypothetical protein IKQ26_00925 [bacterium]|nr:hypothetical protein [bacterium]
MNIVNTKILDLNELIEACFNVYQEIGLHIGEPRTILLRKTISHLECINVLIAEQFTHEIQIILRSALESVVLFCYLTVFPNKQVEYIVDSELLDIKSNFIKLKEFKKDIEIGNSYNIDWNQIVKAHEEVFKTSLSTTSKKYILEKLNMSKYEITEKNFAQIDKFYRQDKKLRKPFFMDLEYMFSQLPPFKDLQADFRDLVFSDYNSSSQITHGHYHSWIRGMEIDEKFLNSVKSQLIKIVLYPLIYLPDKVNINKNNMLRLKYATDKLIVR